MSVNTYKAIGFLITFLPEPVGDYMKAAQEHLRDIADAYDALAPDWANAPDSAMWYAIDPNGTRYWFDEEPESNEWRWTNREWFHDVGYEKSRTIALPLGIDWRMCKWQRPEVTK